MENPYQIPLTGNRAECGSYGITLRENRITWEDVIHLYQHGQHHHFITEQQTAPDDDA